MIRWPWNKLTNIRKVWKIFLMVFPNLWLIIYSDSKHKVFVILQMHQLIE